MKKIISLMLILPLVFLLCHPDTAKCSEEFTEMYKPLYYYSVGTSLINPPDPKVKATYGKFTVSYNQDVLTFGKVNYYYDLLHTSNTVNTEEEGKVVIEFSSDSPVEICNGIMSLTFSASQELKLPGAEVSLEVTELITENENGEKTDVNSEPVSINPVIPASSVTCSDSISDSSGNVSTYIEFEQNYAFISGVLRVEYDPRILSFQNGKACFLLENADYTITEDEPGILRITYNNGSAVNAIGRGFKLDFKVKNEISAYNTIVSVYEEQLTYLYKNEIRTINSPGPFGRGNLIVHSKPGYSALSLSQGTEKNTVLLGFSENAMATEGIITVAYNKDSVKFKNAVFSEGISDTEFKIDDTEPGKIIISFLSGKSLPAGVDFVKLYFSEATEFSVISVASSEISKTDANGISTKINCKMPMSVFLLPQDDVPVKYDTNEDGSITIADLISLVKMINNISEKTPSADINGDGSINSIDLITLVKVFM